MKNIDTEIRARSKAIKRVLQETGPAGQPRREPIAAGGQFDNRPTWDNWPNSPGPQFNNQPTWDNWPNRGR